MLLVLRSDDQVDWEANNKGMGAFLVSAGELPPAAKASFRSGWPTHMSAPELKPMKGVVSQGNVTIGTMRFPISHVPFHCCIL